MPLLHKGVSSWKQLDNFSYTHEQIQNCFFESETCFVFINWKTIHINWKQIAAIVGMNANVLVSCFVRVIFVVIKKPEWNTNGYE